MALLLKDRVKETTTTTGTGDIALAGAVEGFQSFSSALSDADTTYYAISHRDADEWEVGLGTYNSGVLTRTTVLESSNSDTAVSFAAGTKDIFITLPAEKAVVLDASDDLNFGDNDKAIFGAGSDLEIYHSGTTSYIRDVGEGDLQIFATDDVFIRGYATNNYMARFNENGAVTLYHNNAAKLATTSTGVDVTGTITSDGLNVSGSLSNVAAGQFTNTDTANGNGLFVKGGGSNSGKYSALFQNGAGATTLRAASNGDVSFYEDTGTTPKFFWDASAESLGIGNSSPTTALDVTGTITSDALTVSNNAAGIADAIELENFSGDSSYIKAKRGLTLSADYDNNSSAAQSKITFETDGSEAMRIDSSGNVGIGKVPATETLEVNGVVKASGGFIFGNTNSYMYEGSDDTINFRVGSDGPYVEFNDAGSGVLELGNAGGELALTSFGTERMRIDASGRVTMPYQPIAAYSDTRSINLTNVELTSANFYNSQFVNRGGHFNTSTGRFTCPVGGVYRIMWRHTESANANVRIQKNGATLSEGYSSNQGFYNSVSAFAVVDCAANDYLSIQVADFQTIGGTQHKFVSFELIS